ncbi:MAG: CehA/McbA family metallohydrolase [Defluviitaleaceae bacterium]|nr:CehA/McbA family metallohydrolase [Defluviitaleaceae bacterium]
MKILFKSKNLYKANLHCHSTLSDGKLTPTELKEAYKAQGYSIIAFTDHNNFMNHENLNDENFLTIDAVEVDNYERGKPWPLTKVYHLNLYATRRGLSAPPPLPENYGDIPAINKYIENATDTGFLVCYNHPYWSLQDGGDFTKLRGLFAMEIYNHGCETDGYHGYNPQAYDEMLRNGSKLFCVSTDDNHNRSPEGSPTCDSYGGFTYINCETLTYESVISALKSGDFYASQGPQIHEIIIDDARNVTVKCSPATDIVLFTAGRNVYTKRGKDLIEATFKLADGDVDLYFRCMVRDKNHKDANSNAYWL